MKDVTTIIPYVRVFPEVFNVLVTLGANINDVASFFVETAEKVKTCPANVRFKKGAKPSVWVLRDYYPNTKIMFKMTMVYQTPEQQANYHNRKPHNNCLESDFDHALWVNVKLVSPINLQKRFHVPYEPAIKYALAKTANILIGDNIQPDAFLHFKVKKPKRMFPKGYKEV